MSDSADVRSVEQLEVFQTKAERFRAQLLKEIENCHLELRRLKEWIEHEATSYWSEQLKVSQRHFVECQDALVRCMSYVREDERQPCTEQKKRLRKAKERRMLCEEKLRTARAAAAAWERESNKNTTKLQRCRDLAESDMTVAIHHLKGQIERLEEYGKLKSAGVSRGFESKRSEAEDTSVPTSDESQPTPFGEGAHDAED